MPEGKPGLGGEKTVLSGSALVASTIRPVPAFAARTPFREMKGIGKNTPINTRPSTAIVH